MYVTYPPYLDHCAVEGEGAGRVESETGDCFLQYLLLTASLQLDHVKDQHILAHWSMIKAAVKPFRYTTFTQSLY